MGGGGVIHQNVHSGLFWVVSLQLMFSESKCFKKVQNHLEALGWHLALGKSVPRGDSCNAYRPRPQIPQGGSRGLEKVRGPPAPAQPREASPAKQVCNTLLRANVQNSRCSAFVYPMGPPATRPIAHCPGQVHRKREGNSPTQAWLPGVPREGQGAVGHLSLWTPQPHPLPSMPSEATWCGTSSACQLCGWH